MRILQACSIALPLILLAGEAWAQCADPPTSPRGRCIKANGGSCDRAKGIWVSPNRRVMELCAPLSARADRR